MRPEDIRECVNTLPQFEWLRDDLPIAVKAKNPLMKKKVKTEAPTPEPTEEPAEADELVEDNLDNPVEVGGGVDEN